MATTYAYSVRDRAGKLVNGTLEAESQGAVAQRLKAMGYAPLSIAESKAAMTYPVVVFCIAILAVVGMLLFIVPTFAKLFSTLGGTLPAPTRVLVFLSHALKFGSPFIVIGLVGGVIVWRRIQHQDRV